MKKYIHDFQIINNRRINTEYFVLSLENEKKLPEIKPGQFVQVRVDNTPGTFLRRPISVYDVNYEKNIMYLLIQVVGEGTRTLSGLKNGERLNLIYPLGNSFSLPDSEKTLLIGGGVGVAPLMFLGRWLTEQKKESLFLLGFRNSELQVDIDLFRKLGEVYISTDDGSAGEKGVVTQHPVLHNDTLDISMVYTCGPDVMMKAVALWAAKKNIPCEASLENTMACGFGACLCCAQETVHGTLQVCTDGPVFNTKELIWQI